LKIKPKNCINALKLSISCCLHSPDRCNLQILSCVTSQTFLFRLHATTTGSLKNRDFFVALLLCNFSHWNLFCSNQIVILYDLAFIVHPIRLEAFSVLFSMFELFFATNSIIYAQDSRISVQQLTQPFS
jgi:hypothetical protein